MTSAVAVWILLGVGLIHFSTSSLLSWKQFIGSPEPFTGLIPLQVHTRQGNVGIFLAMVPRSLIGALLWPMTIVWSIYLLIGAGMDLERVQSKEGREELSRKLLLEVSTFFPVATLCSAAILLGSLVAILHEPSRPHVLIWLGCVWVSLALWLLSAYIPNNSIGIWIRTEPEHLRKNLLSLVLLFGLVFPVVSSVIATSLRHPRFGLSEILASTYSIYSLGGVLWEGPKHALARLTTQTGDLLQLVTGTILYLVIVTKIRSVASNKLSDEEIRTAAAFKLVVGDLKRAGALVDRFAADDSRVWGFRIIHSLMAGDAERARTYALAKMPELGGYGSRTDVAVAAYLVILTLSWKTPKSAQKEIWEAFLAAKPSEDELLVFWIFLFSSMDKEAFHFSESDFVQAAQERDYFHTLLIGDVMKRRLDRLPALFERAARESSICPATRLLAESVTILGQSTRQPDQVMEHLPLRLEELSSISLRLQTLCGLFLASFALDLLKKSAPQEFTPLADWLRKEHESLKEKVLLYPHGQRIYLLLQEIHQGPGKAWQSPLG